MIICQEHGLQEEGHVDDCKYMKKKQERAREHLALNGLVSAFVSRRKNG
jgi:hypothetical protein